MDRSSLKPELDGENAPATAIPSGLDAAAEADDPAAASRGCDWSSLESRCIDLIARKMKDLRRYDVLGIERVAAICCWGRSGSYLLASFLDGHDDVLTMPFSLGELIYPFWEKHRHLSLRDKLLEYPAFVERMKYDASFFTGEFRISRSEYRASVAALVSTYADQPEQVLESRGTFFRFLVVAYNLAVGRTPANPRPMIVHQQHLWSNPNAQRLLADFPACRFIHTVRDPLSCFDSTLEHFAKLNRPGYVWTQYDPAFTRRPRFNYPAWNALWALAWRDAFHMGLHDRSTLVRFEDLHGRPKETLRRVAHWLGVAEEPVLFESTFNGKPWVFSSGGQSWTGARPQQVRRRARHMSWVDRTIMFALFQENFASWNYPYPPMFAFRGMRALCLLLVLAVPMHSELMSDRMVIRALLLPAMREWKLQSAARALWRTLVARVGLRALLFAELSRRIVIGKQLGTPI